MPLPCWSGEEPYWSSRRAFFEVACFKVSDLRLLSWEDTFDQLISKMLLTVPKEMTNLRRRRPLIILLACVWFVEWQERSVQNPCQHALASRVVQPNPRVWSQSMKNMGVERSWIMYSHSTFQGDNRTLVACAARLSHLYLASQAYHFVSCQTQQYSLRVSCSLPLFLRHADGEISSYFRLWVVCYFLLNATRPWSECTLASQVPINALTCLAEARTWKWLAGS